MVAANWRGCDVAAVRLSSEGGLLVLREVERRLGLADRLAACLKDPRAPEKVVPLEEHNPDLRGSAEASFKVMYSTPIFIIEVTDKSISARTSTCPRKICRQSAKSSPA